MKRVSYVYVLYHINVYIMCNTIEIFLSRCAVIRHSLSQYWYLTAGERRRFRLNERIPVPNRLKLCPFHSVARFRRAIRFPVASPNKYQERPILILQSFLLFCFQHFFLVTHFLQQWLCSEREFMSA